MIVRHAFSPPDNERLAHLCGALDEHLRAIEVGLNVTISRRHEAFRIEGGKLQAQRAMALLESLYERSGRPSSFVRRSTSPASGTMPSDRKRSLINRMS